ncbi:DUF3466 family protein [Candidatus Enterovibrio altilux]|uniref:Uncharacterized protein n=1 Tax=Candidatus Enterovibrio altilux TaxID=1927128 RepID=A0A291BBS6_9GAMM|nr:DUF3466 family protein [Candidatus Enterovibrio luxaltus]ATF10443.1 hypothetical protein BTN50_2029 [Candidatus Enterovibrio luxaltus]
MQFNTIKLSATAIMVIGIPFCVNAAVYNVTLETVAVTGQSSAATAISPDGSQVATEVLIGPVGLHYSEEMPYMVDEEHIINSYKTLKTYCDNHLGYNTCNSWAAGQWYGLKAEGTICDAEDSNQVCYGGLKKEINAWNDGYISNITAAVNGTKTNPFGAGVSGTPPLGSANPDSTNVVINQILNSGSTVGVSSSPYFQNESVYARAFKVRGFNDTMELLPPFSSNQLIPLIGQSIAHGAIIFSGIKITFGSASINNMADPNNGKKAPEGSMLENLSSCIMNVSYTDRACQYFQFANQAAIWVDSYTNPENARIIADFQTGTGNSSIKSTTNTPQASVKSASILTGETAPMMVGFNTYNDNDFYVRAVKYTPILDFATCLTNLNTNASLRCWTMSLIPGIDLRQNGNIIYSYTVANDINTNGIVVGIVKNSRRSNGAYAETVFINEGNSTTLLGMSQSALFFPGYNATVAAINNNNELVGKVDVETARNRSRRQRGYIYLHGSAPNLTDLNNKRGWLLDDLTNDGNSMGNNNQFRIAEAFDIADNGNIAASAFYCVGGYNSTVQNALCNGTEELVAVKLTRVTGDIIPRVYKVSNVSRSGGSIGFIGLGLFAFACAFCRKK